ncbi:MAG TPA: ATP-binding protein [Solirubrobacteraceae bacterium]|jgi:signal transduction histidine kinase|nr:ATP-binding protein [Solirubrobacteraceae bacterium]
MGAAALPRARARLAALARRIGAAVPARTVRFRLTATYGVMFLITGAVLLTIGYALVRHNINAREDPGKVYRHLLPALPPRPVGGLFGPDSTARSLLRAARQQFVSDALHRLVLEYVLALGAMTVISVGAGWLLAGRALRPLREITATARRVSGHNLGERIDLEGPDDELKELADTFDGMLARLDSAFASQRHFVANASHELRTPLAIMRTEVDVTLADPGAGTRELREMGEAVRETIDRCERLIEGLLTLARSEASVTGGERADLAALAGDCLTDLRARAEEAKVQVRARLEPAQARGDGRLLERLIANLIDNGIRYNEPGGFLEVATRTASARAFVRVSNSGEPIDPEEAATLTEPFRRLGRGGDGFGLGLSIVQSVVVAHGGQLRVAASEAGGLDVVVELPAAEPAEAQASAPKESVPSALTPS